MKVFVKKVPNYDLNEIKKFFMESLDEINFWDKIKNIKKILLKPNLLGPFSPDKAVTTHPVFTEAIIQLLLEREKTIIIGDSSGGTHRIDYVYEKTGYLDLATKYKIELLNFGKNGFIEVVAGKRKFYLDKSYSEIDGIINLPKYKTHSLTKFTGAVKNTFGLIPGLIKTDYHRQEPDPIRFSELITDFYQIVRPKILMNAMDGIIGMEGQGPSNGIPRDFGIVFISESAAALDYTASRIMGFDPYEISTNTQNLKRESISPEKILVDSYWGKFCFKKVKLRSARLQSKLAQLTPVFLKETLKRLFLFYPFFLPNCKLCGICVESCPVKALSIEKKDKYPKLSKSKCIKCLCCHEFCPHSAVVLKKSFLANFFIK